MSHPERIVPDETEPGVVALHLKRYAFAEPWCRTRDVLDLGCGVGYGSAFLAATASCVLGADLSDEAIAYARERYPGSNLGFEVMDAASLPLEDASFDVVCSFETIEHLSDRDRYLGEVVRVLRDGGTFIVSTPRAARTTDRPENPHHMVEYSPEDFEALLVAAFERVEVYGQRRLQTRRHRALQRVDVLGLRRRIPAGRAAELLVGTPPTTRATLDDVVIARDGIERATELVAVCTGPRR